MKTAVKGVKRPKYFAECLGVPRSKLQTFSENNFLDHAVSYFMDNDPLASWRRIIVVLDGIDEKETVNEIRDRAEAIRGWLFLVSKSSADGGCSYTLSMELEHEHTI